MLRGKDLGAPLSSLWLCGRVYFPEMAGTYAEVNQMVADGAGDDAAFWWPGRGLSPTLAVWDQLRDTLQRITAQSAVNLYDTGEALVRVADIYLAADDAARQNFNEIVAGYLADPQEFPVVDDPGERRPVAYPEGD